MEELRSWWEVPSIAHFCSLFRAAFNLLDFDIEELEEGLLSNGHANDNYLVTHLILSLLQGCYQRPDVISAENRDKYLLELIDKRWAEEKKDSNVLKDQNFNSLPLRTKVEVLYSLCDYRLEAADVMDLLKNLESDSLRVEPLGKDDSGATYWYFYGTRLYKEERRKRHREKEKQKKENNRRLRRKDKKRLKRMKKDKLKPDESLSSESEIDVVFDLVTKTNAESDLIQKTVTESDFVSKTGAEFDPVTKTDVGSVRAIKVNDESDVATKTSVMSNSMTKADAGPDVVMIADIESELVTKTGWSVVCSSENDWRELAEKFRQSVMDCERELYKRLTEDFIPEIGRIIQDRERNERKKLLEFAPRRVSQRIEKIREQERELETIRIETELQRKAEAEEHRLQQEEDRKRRDAKERQERLLERIAAKEDRARRAMLRQHKTIRRDSCSSTSSLEVVAVSEEETTKNDDEEEEAKRTCSPTFKVTDEELSFGLHEVFVTIQGHEDSWPFLDPVDEEYAPGYFQVVKRPMDMSLIKDKLQSGEYITKEEFAADMVLMFDNCQKYNGPNSEYTKMAITLKGVFHKAMKKFFEEEDDCDRSSSSSEGENPSKRISKRKEPELPSSCYKGPLRPITSRDDEIVKPKRSTKMEMMKRKRQMCDKVQATRKTDESHCTVVTRTQNLPLPVYNQFNGDFVARDPMDFGAVPISMDFSSQANDPVNKSASCHLRAISNEHKQSVTKSSVTTNEKLAPKSSVGYHKLPVSIITATAIRAKTAVARKVTAIKTAPTHSVLKAANLSDSFVPITPKNSDEEEFFRLTIENGHINEVMRPNKVSAASLSAEDSLVSKSDESKESSNVGSASGSAALDLETHACGSVAAESNKSYSQVNLCCKSVTEKSRRTPSRANFYVERCEFSTTECDVKTPSEASFYADGDCESVAEESEEPPPSQASPVPSTTCQTYVLQNGVMSEHAQNFVTMNQNAKSAATMANSVPHQPTYVVMASPVGVAGIPQMSMGQYAQLRLPVNTMLQTAAVHQAAAFHGQPSMVASSGGNVILAPTIQTVPLQFIHHPVQFNTYQMQPHAIDTSLYRPFSPLQPQHLVLNPHATFVSPFPQHIGPKMLPGQPATILQVYPNVMAAPMQTQVGQYYGALQRPT